MSREYDKKDLIYVVMGMAFAFLTCLPYVMLGEKSVVTYHDQLDGELITYLLNAKYLFRTVNYYPEIMGGIAKNGMVSPAPLYVLFFKILPPFGAFVCCMLVNKLVQYCFTYLLVVKLTKRRLIGFATGAWFTCQPFYPVYGLCIPGQPMLCYALWLLWENGREKENQSKGRVIFSLGLIVFYGAASSLALCGFAILGMTFLGVCVGMLLKKGKELKWVFLGGIVLMLTYCVFNLTLIGQLLPFVNAGFHSHKGETVFQPVPFLSFFLSVFIRGEDYCCVRAIYALPVIGIALVTAAAICWMEKRKEGEKDGHDVKLMRKRTRLLVFFLALLILMALWRAFYSSRWMVEMRNASKGAWHDFNFGRITWLMPTFWCLSFAVACDVILLALSQVKKQGKLFTKLAEMAFCSVAAIAALIGMLSGDLKPNLVKLLRGGNYYALSWDRFFAKDLFKRVDELIDRPKEEYHVVSLGIYPAAASYNGFYCLDAYSNNYDVSYKRKFRNVISAELDKNEWLEKWYDEWGNRCYLVIAAYGAYFTAEKRWGPYVTEYDLDFKALKDMGGDYVISATYLVDCEEKGLRLMNEEPIQTEDSWYRLWVYEIKE